MHVATFSALPAEPMILDAPSSLAIWPTAEPTEPAAPETNTDSPARNRPMCMRPTYAVSPVVPRMPRYAETGTPSISSTTRNCRPSACATSRHPRSCRTTAPTGWASDRDSTTRPTAAPVMVSSSSNGGM